MYDFFVTYNKSNKKILECSLDKHSGKYIYANQINNFLIWKKGDIYNIEDLRSSFNLKSTNIQELIIEGFVLYGDSFIKKINAEASILLYDVKKEDFIAIREPLGRFNLYYCESEESLTFSTTLEFFPNKYKYNYDERYMITYLTLINGYTDFTDMTPYKSIKKIKRGSITTINVLKSTKEEKEWSIKIEKKIDYNKDEHFAEKFLHHLTKSIYNRTKNSSKIISQLSGGLDSSGIVAVLSGLRKNESDSFETLSFIYPSLPEADESKFIDITSKYTKTKNNKIRGDKSWLLKSCFTEELPYIDEPSGDIAFYHLRKTMYEQVNLLGSNIMLCGYGADQLLDGELLFLADYIKDKEYVRSLKELYYWTKNLPHKWNTSIWNILSENIIYPLQRKNSPVKEFHNPYFNGFFNKPHFLSVAGEEISDDIICQYQEHFKYKKGYPISTQSFYLHSTTVHTHLWEDSFYKKYGVRNYCPYLDIELISYTLSIPPFELMQHGLRKKLQRNAFKNKLPPDILNRIGHAQFVKFTYTGLKEEWIQIEQLLNESTLNELGLIHFEKFYENFLKVRMGEMNSSFGFIWTILGLEIWLKQDKKNRKKNDFDLILK